MKHTHSRRLLVVVLLLSSLGGVGAPSAAATAAATAPLLVVNSAAPNRFGPYLGEILRAEGLNMFATVELSAVSATLLAAAPLVVLAETPLTAAEAGLLTEYVAGGGRLIAMRPDPQLAPALGITPLETPLENGYIAIDGATISGAGFSSLTLPFHGAAQAYRLSSGAEATATLYSDRTTSAQLPGVIRFGHTATWAYDLAQSIVYSRQGDPARVPPGGAPALQRSSDIFVGAIDKERVATPHADIQMRLLSRIVGDLLADAMPLPRLWYFPDDQRTMMILTGDAHGNPDAAFQYSINTVEAHGGHISLYLARYGQYPSAPDLAAWRTRGHEFGVHPYGAADSQAIGPALQAGLAYFDAQQYGAPSRTTRMHQIEWQGWTDAAEAEAQYGIGLDTSFYTWGPAVTYADGHQAHGYITGSSLPLHFANQDGALIPVYQQPTTLIDEQLIVGDYGEGLTIAQANAVSHSLIDRSQAGDYAAITTQFHIDYALFGEVQAWVVDTLSYAKSLGLPLWTAEHWLAFTEARASTALSGITWAPDTRQLSFDIAVPAGAQAQSVALPGDFQQYSVGAVTIDGISAARRQHSITGRATSFVNVAQGQHHVVVQYVAAAPLQEIVQTTASDFRTCSSADGTMVTAVADGEVRLSGSFGDEYSGTALSPQRWASGTWSGGALAPALRAGKLQLSGADGAYVRSAGPHPVRTLEATVSFATAPWQHIGWGTLGLGTDNFLLFSSAESSTNLYARSAASGLEQRTDLGPIPTGDHTYRIERTTQSAGVERIRYFVDGALAAEHRLSSVPNMYVYQSLNNSDAELQIERLWIYPAFVATGTFTSCILDAGQPLPWTRVSWSAQQPDGTGLQVRVRTSSDGTAWSPWSRALTQSGQAPDTPAGRYVQYRLELSTANPLSSPSVERVAFQLGYHGYLPLVNRR